jgi:hypothetical protein
MPINHTIWKQDIPINDDIRTIAVPIGHVPGQLKNLIVHVGVTAATRPNHLSAWFKAVDFDSSPTQDVHLRIHGTGHLFDPRAVDFIGTVIDPRTPPLVWHVIEVVP